MLRFWERRSFLFFFKNLTANAQFIVCREFWEDAEIMSHVNTVNERQCTVSASFIPGMALPTVDSCTPPSLLSAHHHRCGVRRLLGHFVPRDTHIRVATTRPHIGASSSAGLPAVGFVSAPRVWWASTTAVSDTCTAPLYQGPRLNSTNVVQTHISQSGRA